MTRTKGIRFLNRGEKVGGAVSTGISLHCHSLHSKENLDFVPYYAERITLVSYLWRRELKRSIKTNRKPPSFASGYWTPPLTERQVFDMESTSLAALGLESIVSITDHDSIEANLEIQGSVPEGTAPISMEWTVPFEEAFFHIGVHNMPAESAAEIRDRLLAYTFATGEPDDVRLNELFAMLCEHPGILIVLNHPIWDIEMIGQQRHERALERFLVRHQRWFHAIEVNGFRAWHENEVAIELAERLGLPIVSGGDRHCLHSNTMINVSDAASFAEFVEEVRVHGYSRVVVTPEYQTALPARQLASISQILGNYNDFPAGRQCWSDRIFLDAEDGAGLITLTEHWRGRQPLWASTARVALGIISSRGLRTVIGAVIGDNDIGRDDTRPPSFIEDGHILPTAYSTR